MSKSSPTPTIDTPAWPFPFSQADWEQTPPAVQTYIATLYQEVAHLTHRVEALEARTQADVRDLQPPALIRFALSPGAKKAAPHNRRPPWRQTGAPRRPPKPDESHDHRASGTPRVSLRQHRFGAHHTVLHAP